MKKLCQPCDTPLNQDVVSEEIVETVITEENLSKVLGSIINSKYIDDPIVPTEKAKTLSQIIRVGDYSTGVDCFPPSMAIEGSPDVFINGRAVHRVGDKWEDHSCDMVTEVVTDGPNGPETSYTVNRVTKSGVLTEGSSSVFVNGKPVGRAGDMISDGSVAMTGSSEVYIGG